MKKDWKIESICELRYKAFRQGCPNEGILIEIKKCHGGYRPHGNYNFWGIRQGAPYQDSDEYKTIKDALEGWLNTLDIYWHDDYTTEQYCWVFPNIPQRVLLGSGKWIDADIFREKGRAFFLPLNEGGGHTSDSE
ncbi:MAG: hypothetical protein LBR90_04565 [Elusimicrobiota bacterium]|jgi:hypothetical protein|nr:hypothetical protein [Elusimicrobiota bacterium]